MSRSNTKIHKGVHNAKTFSKTASPNFVKTKKIWVRKSDLTCFVVHTALKARDSHMWYLDSGCSHHMFGDKSYSYFLKNIKEELLSLEMVALLESLVRAL